MRALTAIRLVLRLRLSAVVLATLVVIESAAAQQIQFGFGTPAQAELTSPQINLVSGATATRLEQARALSADKNWDEAIDTLRELAADDTDRVVALDESRFVNLRTYCHLLLSQLPADALAVYRHRVDPLAEQWYHAGLAARDEAQLRRVVDELFCSSWGDDALMALGELALERADYAAARRWWGQISPLLRDPNGFPVWLALRDIDLGAHWPAVEHRWFDRTSPPTWLAYPDTQLDLADVRARLILVSMRARQLERAALELEVFRHLHPTAVGRLGGQEGSYVAALERLLTSAAEWPAEPRDENWPTFAGSQTRSPEVAEVGPIAANAWRAPVTIAAPDLARNGSALVFGGLFRGGFAVHESPVTTRETERPLSCFPVVVDRAVVFGDAAGIRAVDLATGEPAITTDGVLYRNESLDDAQSETRLHAAGTIAHGVPRYTLTAISGIAYGRIGRLATTQLESRRGTQGDRLVGFDLARDGLLAFRGRPEDTSWSFDGAPVGDGRRLFVAMRHSDVSPHAYVACFDAATGTRLWRTSIGAADTPAAGRGDEITHNLLTLVGDRIYFNTNLGLVAALDAENGRICWLRRYDRLSGDPFVPGLVGPLHFDRDPSPCLFHDGLLVVAAADTPSVFALDAETGQTIWTTDQMPDALHLLGVVRQNLAIGGNRLRIVDIRSGQVRFIWPASEHAGIRGMGRGLVAGDEIFWPTRSEIYAFNAVTGARTRTPIDIGSLTDCGANLAAAHGRLIVAAHDTLMAFGPRMNPQPSTLNSQL